MGPNTKNRNNYFLLASSLIFLVLALYLHKKSEVPKMLLERQDTAINVNSDTLRFISFGNKRILSSLLWIQTLIQSDESHYEKRDQNNWMFIRFKTIAALEPEFYYNYLWGGMYLSIVKDDLTGATDIYEMGLREFPNDYDLNYNAGFHYFFELNNHEKGLEKLARIESHPATPVSIKSIISKLKFEAHRDYDVTINFLKFNIEKTSDPIIKKKFEKDLYTVETLRDLDCLNSKKADCSLIDPGGVPYIKKDGRWKSAVDQGKYQLAKPKK